MTDEIAEVIITGPSPDWLAEFSRELIERRLAACAQHFHPIRSLYHWQGKIEDEPEARVALHTRRALVPEIIAQTNDRHPYDVPCVIALPVLDANPAYAQWVVSETRVPGTETGRPPHGYVAGRPASE